MPIQMRTAIPTKEAAHLFSIQMTSREIIQHCPLIIQGTNTGEPLCSSSSILHVYPILHCSLLTYFVSKYPYTITVHQNHSQKVPEAG